MTGALHAAYYADGAVQRMVEVVENVKLARDTYRLRFRCPEMARRIVPGQFVMLRLSGVNDPLIGRPLALYDTVAAGTGEPDCINVVYLVKGKFTSRVCQLPAGQRLDVWGPLGNGFQVSGEEFNVQSSKFKVGSGQEALNFEPGTLNRTHLIMVAGGIGQTPFLAVAQEALGRKQYGDAPRQVPPVAKVTFCYGARTADYFAGVEDFQRLGVDVQLATDDGSRGHHGLVTDLLSQILAAERDNARIVCCGPEPMMKAVSEIALAANVPCSLSLETPMACGVGICFTCVAKIRQPDGDWDYKRTCVEGPIFDAAQILW